MIITRTPLRISLVGGGTDIPEFYQRKFGAVVSFAIDKYVYVSVNPKFDGRTRVSYSQTENVDNPRDLKHDLARETLKHFDLRGLEITSVSDIPGEGTGLGSSSAFTVGLCVALNRLIGGRENVHPEVFAKLAYGIESGRCEHPVGQQDQFACAYGGLHYYQFNSDHTVTVELLPLESDQKFFLTRDLMLFWTGQTRNANSILAEQAKRMEKNQDTAVYADRLRDLAVELAERLRAGDIRDIGDFLHEGWYCKKNFSRNVSDEVMDTIYEKARSAGATGGKLCGAGGGGFFLFAVPPDRQEDVRRAVGLRQVPFRIVDRGSEIIYDGERDGTH